MSSRLLLCWTSLWLLAATASGQATGTPQAPAFGEVIDVRVINLEVVVTDGDERVSGLSADDFRLLVDGEEVPIEYFTEVAGGKAVEATASAPAGGVQPGEEVGTHYLLFIDDYFTVPAYRDRVLDRLAEQLPRLGPADRMAIVGFDGRRIDMLTNWTASGRELKEALTAAKGRRASGLQRLAEARRYDELKRDRRRFDDAAAARRAGDDEAGEEIEEIDDAVGKLPPEDLQRSWEISSQVKRAVTGATSALRAFGQPPGRKVMLLLSGGWPASPASWVVGSFEASLSEARLTRGDALLRPLADVANLLGYTLYPVDVAYQGSGGAGADLASAEDAGVAARLATDRDRVEEEALLFLAASTGGRAFLDGSRFAALESAVEDTRSYYWLGFSPTWVGDDARHDVDVEVAREGLKVRTRSGFSDLSRQTEVTMMVESAQLLDLPLPGRESGLGASLGEPKPAGFRKITVPVRLEIPLDRITMMPEDGGFVARLELRVAATDDGDHTTEIPVIPVVIRGGRPPEPGETGVFDTAILLRKRAHRLLLALYDPLSGEVLSTRLDFEP